MFVQYIEKRFQESSLSIIQTANDIIDEYESLGYTITLRQLYYQFVSRDIIPNSQKEYSRLGSIINDARLAGLVSWTAIIDRTRNLKRNPYWQGAEDFMESVIPQFAIDKWANQHNRVEVWIEKDALVGVIEGVCGKNDVPYFSCRGYTSQSEMWAAGRRLERYEESGQRPIIIHLGDHDPSGKDMTRDIEDRMAMFVGMESVHVNRIALNMKQIEKYNPPPNPAKLTDSRCENYIRQYGNESWELDALEPTVLSDLVEETILYYRDGSLWDKMVEVERDGRERLNAVYENLKGNI